MTLKQAFEFLKITPTYDKAKIKKAYLHMVKIYHPDKMRDKSNEEREKIIYQINDAYNIILTKIEGGDAATNKIADQSFNFEYEGLEGINNDDYQSQNDEIIDMLFTGNAQPQSEVETQTVYINIDEAKTGIQKNVQSIFNELITLNIPPNTEDGHIIVQDGNCFEIKIKK